LVLGGRLLWTLARGDLTTRHVHGASPHAHLSVGDLALALTHLHLDEESFVVGVLHGFAGSGALVVLLVAAAPSTDAAVGFLAGFCVLSIVSMAAVSALWDRALGTPFPRYLEGAAGVFGILVGAVMLVEQIVALGPV
ncbi:MAG TPA: hypothetical protein VKA37_13305, partial [Halobacteriales archaeon]|nr:hypothetical protein [Halobacteriales archaeon]